MNPTKLAQLHRAICALDGPEIRRISKIQVSSDRVFWKSVHKARASLTVATPEQRAESVQWLYANGSQPFPSTGEAQA